MFGRKQKKIDEQRQKIQELEWKIDDLQHELWGYKNPPKYNQDDFIEVVCALGDEGVAYIKGEIIGIERDTWGWRYVILEEGPVARVVNENHIYKDLREDK